MLFRITSKYRLWIHTWYYIILYVSVVEIMYYSLDEYKVEVWAKKKEKNELCIEDNLPTNTRLRNIYPFLCIHPPPKFLRTMFVM